MRKLATLLVLGGAVGLPLPAMAVDVATVDCFGIGAQPVGGSHSSAGVTLPPSCAAKAPDCAQCLADLMSSGFTLAIPTSESGVIHFVLKRSGRGD